MKTITLSALLLIVLSLPLHAEEFAIIKDALFGKQNIKFYPSEEEALKNFDGEGKVYGITKREIPVVRKEKRKKVEVTEYEWVVEQKKTVKPQGSAAPAEPKASPNQKSKAAGK